METAFISWIILALIAHVKVLCNPLNSSIPLEITYAELEALGTSCFPSDSCQRNDTNVGLYVNNCDCDISCSVYNTCCLDSEFKINEDSPPHKSNLECLRVNSSPGFEIFMVRSCKNDKTSDNLCFSSPEESDDPFLMIPVTSNATGFTYKNYFCSVCNEENIDSSQLEFWDIQTLGEGTLLKNLTEPQFKFNNTIGSWTVFDGESDESSSTAIPVTLKIQRNPQATVRYCSSNLVETCSSNWTDESVAEKCRDYMAVVTGSLNVKYRNTHCAICNFENLRDLRCFKFGLGIFPGGVKIPPAAFAPASASAPGGPSVVADIPLLDLFVLKDRHRRCGKNMVYDKFADKCRCNSRIYIKENGKCVHKI